MDLLWLVIQFYIFMNSIFKKEAELDEHLKM